MGIDTATGLPALPENHFWRIHDSCVEIRENVPAGEWEQHYGTNAFGLRSSPICLYGSIGDDRYEHDHKDEAYTVQVRPHWWSIRKVSAERIRNVCYRRRLPGSVSVYSEQDEYLLVTADTVVERCTELLAEWEKWISAMEIVGDYPPKTFPPRLHD